MRKARRLTLAGPLRTRRTCFAAAAALGAVAIASGLGLAPQGAEASSHREAPLIAGDPEVDNTDVYAFVSPDKQDTVTLISNWLPFEEPNGGPNFYFFQPGANYDINVDSNGDGRANITYRWVFSNVDNRDGKTFLYNNGPVNNFDDPTLLFKQTYTLTEIRDGQSTVLVKDGPVGPSNVGPASMPNYSRLRQQAVTSFEGGGQSFAGQADDSFFLDLRVFDLIYGGNLSERGQDGLAGYNVQTVAIQVPKSDLALNGDAAKNPVIGVWSSTAKKTMTLSPGKAEPTGDQVQVSRLGNPLVNEVISSADLKDPFNGSMPNQDHTNQALVNRVTNPELPQVIQAIYNIPAPATPRNDLVEIFLTGIAKNAPTLDGSPAPIQADLNAHLLNQDADKNAIVPAEELRLNMGVPVTANPNRLGVLGQDPQGFPNGRRLADDVLDIELQALEGAAQSGQIVQPLAAGDEVNVNDKPFGDSFPYIALPNNKGVNQSGGQMPSGGSQTGAGGTAPGSEWLGLGAGAAALVMLATGLVIGRRYSRLDATGRR